MNKFYIIMLLFLLIFSFSNCNKNKLNPEYYNDFVSEEVILNVPFITQYPPGTGWDKTKNCGQTTFLMAYCYQNGINPSVEHIKEIDDWMSENLRMKINKYNGSPTNIRDLYILATEFKKMKETKYYSHYSLNLIEKDLKQNQPVIVSVYYPSPGNKDKYINHSLLVTGLTLNKVIVNDPGRTNGRGYKFSKDKFLGYWDAHSRDTIVIRN